MEKTKELLINSVYMKKAHKICKEAGLINLIFREKRNKMQSFYQRLDKCELLGDLSSTLLGKIIVWAPEEVNKEVKSNLEDTELKEKTKNTLMEVGLEEDQAQEQISYYISVIGVLYRATQKGIGENKRLGVAFKKVKKQK